MGVDHFFQDILLNYFNLQLKDASYLLTLLFIIDVFLFFRSFDMAVFLHIGNHLL